MIIKEKIMRNVTLTAHPQGCARYVKEQLEYLENHRGDVDPSVLPKNVLVVGGSTGYGLSSRMVPAVYAGSATLNVSFEREPAEKKTATPGYYMSRAFEQWASQNGVWARSINGDAFSHQVKKEAADIIASEMGKVDLIVYSLASPMRMDPDSGQMYRSVIKPIGDDYSSLSLDMNKGIIEKVTLEGADEDQIAETVKVMGGEDWKLWISYLKERELIAEGAMSVAYSYIGPEVTFPMYRSGTIGKAKEDLERSAHEITQSLSDISGRAFVSVNKALVTRASSVIPVVPLYISLLYQIMKEKGTHEECIQQIYRLYKDRLYAGAEIPVDEAGRIRVDDLEMTEDVQKEVMVRWDKQREGEVLTGGDLDGFRSEYSHIHGFGYEGIDYDADVDPRVVEFDREI